MATVIKTKNGSGAPLASDLVQGELAIDLTNKRLYTENASGTIIELGTSPSTIDINGGTIDGTVIGGSSAAAGTFTTITASGEITANGGIALGDNDKATFGASDDLQIYHDGTDSIISESGVGSLDLRGTNVEIKNAAGTEYCARFITNDKSSLYYDGAEKLATTSTGIDVTGTVTADGLSILSNTTGNAAFLYNSDSSANGTVLKLRSGNVGGTTDVLSIFDGNNNEQARFTASGRLGLGTSSPGNLLEVAGATPIVEINSTSGSPELQFSDGGVDEFSIQYDTGANALKFVEGGVGTHVTILDGGNVGIGTSSPSTRLHVNTGSAGYGITVAASTQTSGTYQIGIDSNSALAIYDTAATAQRLVLSNSGNVGIGTSSPAARLDLGSVSASTQTAILARNSSGDADFKLIAGTDSGTAANTSFFEMGIAYETGVYQPNAMLKFFRGTAATGGFLAFTTNNDTERMRIDSSGNLLVGKTTANTFNSTAGHEHQSNGLFANTRDGGIVQILNRLTSDGDIAVFRKDGSTVGSIGTSSSSLYIGKSSGSGLMFQGGNTIPVTGSSAADATYDLGASGVRFKDLYLSGGVYLGGNLLDDYEEGTWTPTIVGSTTAGAFTYDIQEGKYTKVGNMVSVNCAIYITATSISPAGSVKITGLPFTVGNQFPSFAIGWSQNITFTDQLAAYGGATQITLRDIINGGSGSNIQGSAFGSAFYIFVSGTYQV